jgi:hypothetical protein
MKQNKCVARMMKARQGRWFECTSKGIVNGEPDCRYNAVHRQPCPFRILSRDVVHCGCMEAQLKACSPVPVTNIDDRRKERAREVLNDKLRKGGFLTNVEYGSYLPDPTEVIADCPKCGEKMPQYTGVCPGGRWFQYRCECGYESDMEML